MKQKNPVILELEEANTLTPWVYRPRKRCSSCGENVNHFMETSRSGTVCCECCESVIEKELPNSKADTWSRERIEEALSTQGSMMERLAVLTYIHPIQLRMDLSDLLIDNMGFVSDHPMSKYVRQKAFEASCTYHNKNIILRKLLKIETYKNWQHKVNVAKTCFNIDPSNTKCIARVINAASDNNPLAKIDISEILNNINAPWAVKVWDTMCRDPNPLVRESCEAIAAKSSKQSIRQQPFTRSPQTRTVKSKPAPKEVYTTFEKTIQTFIDVGQLNYKVIYSRYLSHMLEFMDAESYEKNKFEGLKVNSLASSIRLIAEILSSKPLFEKLLGILPAEVGILIYLCTWERENEFSKVFLKHLTFPKNNKDGKKRELNDLNDPNNSNNLNDLKELFGLPGTLLALLGDRFLTGIKWDEELIENPEFFLFNVEKLWSSTYRQSGYNLFIHKDIIPHLKKLLPLPEGYNVQPLSQIDNSVDIQYEENDFFEQLPSILAFISQDNLEFTTTEKIKVCSLIKMSELCGIKEFYNGNDTAIKNLKTASIANFFISGTTWKENDLKNLPRLMKRKIKQYLDFKTAKALRSRDQLFHIKHKLLEYDFDENEKEIRQSLHTMLTLLPEGKWVSVEKLVNAAAFRDLCLNPFPSYAEHHRLKLGIALPKELEVSSKKLFFQRNRGVPLSYLDSFHAVSIPLTKALFFLLGSLNVVALGYSDPVNKKYHLEKKNYLSIFDGLQYIRLTEFGAFLLDRKKSYVAPVKRVSAEIVIDENRTTLSIIGEDPVKRLALERVGKKINRSTYMVDTQSFLGDCTTPGDVEMQIAYFRSHISRKPPEVWESFFESMKSRMQPMKKVSDMHIFKITPNKELISLLTTDAILKRHVFKAENYLLLVNKKDYAIVKKRLEHFGFFS